MSVHKPFVFVSAFQSLSEPHMIAQESTSTRPYLIRALHEWCTDNGLTPHLAVQVDNSVQVPREYVKDGEIVLNLALEATSGMRLGNDFIEFTARFAGKPRDIMIPVGRVTAIYARENGQGMAFPPPVDMLLDDVQLPPTLASVPVAKTSPMADQPGADADRVVQLVTSESQAKPAPDQTAMDNGDGLPPRPPSGSRKKPALKRIK